VYDVGVHDGAPYLVSELLEGESLQRRISRGPISPTRAIHLARQIAEGLAAAHAKGIVHRDVKPANLFVGDDEITSRFSISALPSCVNRATAQQRRLPTRRIGTVIGTVDYMSPEQVRGEAIDGPVGSLQPGHRSA
jgi:serine/threonine protein kinase